jgi:hypothetical protein
LEGNIDNNVYTAECPSFSQLLTDFGLDYPCAFHLSRMAFREKLSIEMNKLDPDEESTILVQNRLQVIENALNQFGDEISKLNLSMAIPVRFFVLFWTLDIADIKVPSDHYTSVLQKISENISQLESELKVKKSYRKQREKSKIELLAQKINLEYSLQLENMIMKRKYLEKASNTWFLDGMPL